MKIEQHRFNTACFFLLLGVSGLSGCAEMGSNKSQPIRPFSTSGEGADVQAMRNGARVSGTLNSSKLIFTTDAQGTPLDPHGRPVPFEDAQALASLQELCSGCHAPGKSVHASWAFPEEAKLNLQSLRGLERMEVAYQALLKKYLRVNDSSPSPMPPNDLDDEKRVKLARTLTWMQDKMPQIVARAESQYPLKAPFQSEKRVQIEYRCKSILKANEILSRFTGAVLGRPPNKEEKEFGEGLISQIRASGKSEDETSLAYLTELANKAFNAQDPWFAETMSVTGALFGLAQKIASTGEIKADLAPISPAGVDPVAAKKDLKEEFYRLLVQFAPKMPYSEVLLKKTVMVSPNTAFLYPECKKPEKGWEECTLSDTRSNFFGTRGFLMAKPSYFISSNNNYGRGGDLYTVLSGSILMANTDGVSGDAPALIPACLSSTDARWKLKDEANPSAGKVPWGALSVPDYGKVCQSCHLNRHLAAASHLFRPFGMMGEQINPEHLRQDSLPSATDAAPIAAKRPNYIADLKMSLSKIVVNIKPQHSEGSRPEVVDKRELNVEDLVKMLEEVTPTKPICSLSQEGNGKTVAMGSLTDLARESIGNGSILVEGFTRYFPSVYLDQTKISGETREVIAEAMKSSGGYLLPILKAYFSSRSFICSQEVPKNE